MSEPIVSSLAKALRVLECFTVSEPELGVTEISKKLGIGKSNAHNIISTYCQMGYLQQLPNRKYTLGYKLLEHAFIINQHLGYPHAVYDLLLEAAERTGQVVYFGIPYETDVLYLYVAHPIARMKELPYREICGEHAPLCTTGIGKAILANLPPEEWLSRLPEIIPAHTPQTITDKDKILQELQSTRERGFAIDNCEHELNVRCVGVPVNLIFSIAAVPTDAHGAAQKVFKETLESISGGNMTVECYDSGTLYGQDTEHDALKNGDVDMIYSSASWLTDGSPWISMFTAGYVFQSYDHMTKVLNGDIGKDMFQKVAEEQGILPLGAFYLGTRQISLSQDKQIKTPEDLKGINLRMPNSDAWVFLGKAMGANPTAVGFNDLYLALQTGTVDGQDNPLPTVKSAKFYEVQKSISLTNHLVDSVWPTINLNTWNKLTDTQKGWVMKAVEAARVACDEQNIKTESEVQDFLREQGLTIYEADVAAFADHVLETYLADPISDTWDKDLLAQIQAMA